VASGAAKRYAKAVFEVAQSEGRIEHWEHSLARLHELFSDPKVAEVLSNPTIAASERMQFVAESPHLVDPEATNFAKLLIESNRVRDIDGIVDRITKDLSKRLNKEVKLRVEVDPRILGGLKLQYGDHVVDGTVATKLQQLRRRLVAS
jgi:F-type H+-transporting ATPase subunit delta